MEQTAATLLLYSAFRAEKELRPCGTAYASTSPVAFFPMIDIFTPGRPGLCFESAAACCASYRVRFKTESHQSSPPPLHCVPRVGRLIKPLPTSLMRCACERFDDGASEDQTLFTVILRSLSQSHGVVRSGKT